MARAVSDSWQPSDVKSKSQPVELEPKHQGMAAIKKPKRKVSRNNQVPGWEIQLYFAVRHFEAISVESVLTKFGALTRAYNVRVMRLKQAREFLSLEGNTKTVRRFNRQRAQVIGVGQKELLRYATLTRARTASPQSLLVALVCGKGVLPQQLLPTVAMEALVQCADIVATFDGPNHDGLVVTELNAELYTICGRSGKRMFDDDEFALGFCVGILAERLNCARPDTFKKMLLKTWRPRALAAGLKISLNGKKYFVASSDEKSDTFDYFYKPSERDGATTWTCERGNIPKESVKLISTSLFDWDANGCMVSRPRSPRASRSKK